MKNVKLSRALAELDAEFDKDTLDWLIRMYDGKSGGFYYSQSSIDTDRFEPDIESTTQAISIIAKLGLCDTDSSGRHYGMPEWFVEGAYEFLSSRQEEGDGYFYDPVYRLTANKAKKERNTASVINCFDGYIYKKPLYPTPMERLKDNTVKKSSVDADLKMYSDKDSFIAWLEETVAKRGDSYCWGSDLSSARSMITAAGLLPVAVEWLKERQNKENGTWEKDFNMTAVNGVLKISGFFNKDTEDFPNYEIYAKNVIEFTKTFSPGSAAHNWNPMGSLRVILDNLRVPPSEEIKALLDDGIADMIINTTAKMREFRQPDHGFGYGRRGSSRISNEVEVSLGLPEGDVNALALMTLIFRDSYIIAKKPISKVWAKYYDYFFEEIKKKYDFYHK